MVALDGNKFGSIIIFQIAFRGPDLRESGRMNERWENSTRRSLESRERTRGAGENVPFVPSSLLYEPVLFSENADVRADTAHVTEFAVDTATAESKLEKSERAKYFASGSMWVLVTLVLLAIDQAILFVDGPLMDIMWLTSALTAYRQLKAAVTGSAESCVKFTCTKEMVTDNFKAFFKKAKEILGNIIFGKRPCVGHTCYL